MVQKNPPRVSDSCLLLELFPLTGLPCPVLIKAFALSYCILLSQIWLLSLGSMLLSEGEEKSGSGWEVRWRGPGKSGQEQNAARMYPVRKDSIFNKKYQKIYCMKKISFQLKRMHSSDTLLLGEYSGKRNKRAERGEPALLYCGTSPIGQTMESVHCLSADKYIRKMWHG